MEVGTKVRVTTSVVIYHHPEHKTKPFDLQGQEGEIVALVNQWQGRPVSANFPYLVKFGPKLKVHLSEQELETV
ncbi:MAG: ferredoxin-thioredoxin reductase variable chain [Synechococcales bacterium]|nr:ferredoxin-thioredoxin reductase variable chain [Synechococcales bacterium]